MSTRLLCRLRPALPRILAAGVAVFLSACSSSEPQQTSTAVYEQALANIADARATATIAHARIQTTLDYAGTRVQQADSARTFLASNLISLGTESAFIDANIQQLDQISTAKREPPAARTAGPAAAAASRTLAPDLVVTPPALTPAPAAAASGPRLEKVAMASGVNEFDCARDINPRFTPASTEIYVVGRAFDIPAGATISSTWRRAGLEVVSFSFVRDHDINDSCIWFFIDQTDTPFIADFWSVEIMVDGLPLASPVAFQIVDG